MNTKILLTAFGLAALVATPAFAQKQVHSYAGAYASAQGQAPVIEGGKYVGNDPDPAIRSELERDSSTYTSSN